MQRIWEVSCTALFYLTPVFYPLSIISDWKRGSCSSTHHPGPHRSAALPPRWAGPRMHDADRDDRRGAAAVILGVAWLRRAERRIADELMKF